MRTTANAISLYTMYSRWSTHQPLGSHTAVCLREVLGEDDLQIFVATTTKNMSAKFSAKTDWPPQRQEQPYHNNSTTFYLLNKIKYRRHGKTLRYKIGKIKRPSDIKSEEGQDLLIYKRLKTTLLNNTIYLLILEEAIPLQDGHGMQISLTLTMMVMRISIV